MTRRRTERCIWHLPLYLSGSLNGLNQPVKEIVNPSLKLPVTLLGHCILLLAPLPRLLSVDGVAACITHWHGGIPTTGPVARGTIPCGKNPYARSRAIAGCH